MQPTTERELPMLAGIGAFVTWCEELLAILSGPILTFGLAIALVALLTDGALLVRIPALLYVWAASQAVGLDAQFIGSAAKLARAIRQRRGWPIFGYIVLCTALGYVGYVASNVFATQEANGITTAAALARLGMDSTSWIVQRSALAVGLVFLSGLLRYVAPQRDAALSAEEERDRLQRELELEPLRNQLRAQQLRGVRGAWGALRGKDSTIEQPLPPPLPASGRAAKTTPLDAQEEPPQKPPTGPGTPVSASKRRNRGAKRPGTARIVPLRSGSAEERIRQVVAERPKISVRALTRRAGVSESTASKWLQVIAAERAQVAQSANQAVQ